MLASLLSIGSSYMFKNVFSLYASSWLNANTNKNMATAKLDYHLGKEVLRAIGKNQLSAIGKIPIASLALEATYGPGSLAAATAFMQLSRLRTEVRKAPFDRDLHQQLARVLALFGTDYPVNKVLDKRMQRLAKKQISASPGPVPKHGLRL
jgi:hypothetical protein